MRLIDADNIKFTEYINGDITVSKEKIQNMSTAYDVDKVVKSINKTGRRYCNSVKCDKNCNDCEHGCLMRTIEKIVKSGGIADE